MTKYILILAFTLAFALAPAGLRAAGAVEPSEQGIAADKVTITILKQKIRVTGAQDKTLQVYSITGTLVASVKIDSQDKTVHLNLGRGYYIAKVGTTTQRFSLL